MDLWQDATEALEERQQLIKKRLEEMISCSFLESSASSRDSGDVTEEEEEEEEGIEETILVEASGEEEGGVEVDAVTHFCFLVHGYRGKPEDLSYLRSVMKMEAKQRLRANEEDETGEVDSSAKSSPNELDKKNDTEPTSPHQSRLAIHNVQANLGKTSDGVAKGGDRVLEEIITVIRNQCHKQQSTDRPDQPMDVTLSIVGNSLGGLYSRYAVSRLFAMYPPTKTQSSMVVMVDDWIRIHLNIFCTTATPHLGVSGNTFFPVPRSAEIAGGSLMGQTGRDLFRIESNLLKTMCTCPTFLHPLASFEKRIAYANAYQTDFVVPTQTAAFLNPESSHPHYFESGRDGMIVATFRTETVKGRIKKTLPQDDNEPFSADSHSEDLLQMSNALDKLGWKKVIVDVRSQLPRIKHPLNLVRKISLLSSSFDSTDSDNVVKNEDDSLSPSAPIPSKDILKFFSGSEGEISFPLGHNTLVAVDHQAVVSTVFKKGRPVMDKLGNELINEIFSWRKR